jgi:NAD(P)-dependent dehydrogenase (short-subunit alcohol dehydrogenase family)
LGQATAHAFYNKRANLVLVDRRPDRLQTIFPDMATDPKVHFATSVDLTNEGDVARMVAEAIERFNHIDCLVNIAGGYRGGQPVHETGMETWEMLMNLNARTAFIVSKAVIPELQKRTHGQIINIGAYAALSGKANLGAYISSKSAVIRLTESMAEELRSDNINVNCLLPNVIDTPANREASPKADYSRWVKPEAIADVILMLTSNQARSIYGASIPVRGPC